MARYTDDSRERVRDAVDFVELVGARTELKPAGPRRMTGLCPFHDERTPSFGIDPVEKLYHCFGCGAGGDVFKFAMETEGLDFAAALEALAERSGVELEREAEDPREAERRGRRDRLGRQPIAQTHAAALTASVVGEHPPSRGQQPRQRVLRQLVPAAPRDQEHVRDHVIRRLGIAPAHRVATYRTGVKRVQRLEILFDPHSQKCPAARADYKPECGLVVEKTPHPGQT